ncbi:MAG: ABC transporter substrate-binding protein [Humidesulfovibrio sp.]|uniref:ABC transporter substrate-binding protein n=1 Tax=Humidesulfovibrio sp. TaxID=2910988 RepID=UPI0027FF667E|nr:ABC transporter substrate-binding protein [Humidesulfovibrio sp.]MDQ7834723.1 ABC transporter substrate-binding protein [Humidesulfovibrio sp.]
MKMARAVVIALALMTFLGCSKESDSLKIGAVLSVTGPASFLGEPEKNTLLLLQDEINAKGGVEGRKVQVIVYDDESDVNKCVMAAKKLIEQDKVAVVLGPSISGNTLAISKFFAPAKIPLVSCSAAEKIVKPVDPWVFNTPQLDRHAVGKILADAKKKGFAKIAILTVSDGYGQAGRAVLQELVPAQGLTLVADEVFGPKDTDMSAQLTKIKGSAPDAIICWGTNPGPAVVARNRAQLGITTPLYMSHGVASKKFIELAGESAEGIILPAGRLVAVSQVPDGHPQKALLTKYVDDYTKKYGTPPSTFGGHAYDAFALVIEAVKLGKSIKSEDIRANLEKITNMPGTAGVYTMTPENHNGLNEDAFLMVVIEKGDWKVVD